MSRRKYNKHKETRQAVAQERDKTRNLTGRFKTLQDCCLQPFEWFEQFGERVDTPDGRYIYHREPGAKILAVAHLDSVADVRHFHVIEQTNATMVYAGTLDDRLGAWLILYILRSKAFGLKYDILLTEGEETGHSTAAHFKPPEGVEYNWGFECDRTGTDVVCYDYETPALRQRLTAAGFKVGHGSFTDICKLGGLGVEFFNVGVAYHDYHSWKAFAVLEDTYAQMQLLKNYYEAHSEERFEHVPRTRYYSNTQPWYGFEGGYYDFGGHATTVRTNSGYWAVCDGCRKSYPYNQENGRSINETGFCLRCLRDMAASGLDSEDAASTTTNPDDGMYANCPTCGVAYWWDKEPDRKHIHAIAASGKCISCQGRAKQAKEQAARMLDGSPATETVVCTRCNTRYVATATGPNSSCIQKTGLCIKCCGIQWRADITASATEAAIQAGRPSVVCNACQVEYLTNGINHKSIDRSGICLDCLALLYEEQHQTATSHELAQVLHNYVRWLRLDDKEAAEYEEPTGLAATTKDVEWSRIPDEEDTKPVAAQLSLPEPAKTYWLCGGCKAQHVDGSIDAISIQVNEGKCLDCATRYTYAEAIKAEPSSFKQLKHALIKDTVKVWMQDYRGSKPAEVSQNGN